MKIKTAPCGIISALFLLTAGSLTVQAALVTPPGLNPGDQFRVVIVTGYVSDATSTSISTYNSTVNSQTVGATYDGFLVSWRAIASTSSISAIDNVGVYDVPVYLPTGVIVATSDGTSSGGLWSGTVFANIDSDVEGNHIGAFVWTGTSANGQASASPLGDDVTFTPSLGINNYPTLDNGYWVELGPTGNQDGYFALQSLYGISEVLTVPVPEPTSAVMLLGSGAMLLRRRRRAATQTGHCEV